MILSARQCGRRLIRLAPSVPFLALCALLLATLHADQRATKTAADPSQSAVVLRVDPLLIAEAGEVWKIIASPMNPIWPGWNATGTPLLFYLPGEQDVLINHPHPPQGFMPYDGPPPFAGARLAVKNGPTLIDSDGQNTSKDVAGVQTLVVADTLSNLRNHMADLLRDTRPADEKVQNLHFPDLATNPYQQLGLVVHEAFHVFQHAQAADKAPNEMLLATYPVLSVPNNVGFAEEGSALAEALRSADAAAFRRAAVRWLAVRNDRRASMSANAVAYEDGVEFSEGLANYTEYRLFQILEGRQPGAAMSWAQGFAGYANMQPPRMELIDNLLQNMSGSVVVNNDPYGTGPVRRRLYYSGMAVGVMLDRLLPAWKQRILAPDVSLTSLVQEGLQATPAELAKALDALRSGPDYAALVESKTKLAEAGKAHTEAVLNDIEKGPGTGIIIDYSNLESPRLGMSVTPFGITRVDGERMIFSQIPIRVAFGKEGEVTQKVAAPLLRDTGRRLVRFRLLRVTARAELEKALASVQTSDGIVTNLALETSDVTIKAARARITWSGPDLMITLERTVDIALPAQRGSVAPTVEEMLNAHAMARGGAEAWRAVTSLVRSRSGPFVTVETTWVRATAGRPDRVRIDQNSEYRSGETRAFDGETGWEQGESGLRQLSSVEVQELREDAAEMVELLAAKDLGVEVSMAGADSLDGKPVWKLAVSLRSGRKLTLWLDAKTWLEVGRSKLAMTPDGATTEIWTTLGDYRKVNGLELPHAINGAAATYKINATIADGYFKKPASLLWLAQDHAVDATPDDGVLREPFELSIALGAARRARED